MKKKFLSAMLFGLVTLGISTTFQSCKDYDDDISSLKSQVSAAALKTDLDNLDTELSAKISAAESSISSLKTQLGTDEATIAAAKKTAEAAAADAAAAITQADNAKLAADEAQKTADHIVAALSDFVTKDELKSALADYATATQLKVEVEKLESRLDLDETSIKVLQADYEKLKAAYDKIWGAVTSVELYGSWNGTSITTLQSWRSLSTTVDYLPLSLLKGQVGVDSSTFGDEDYKAADATVSFTKGADITFNRGIVVRVNPINATFTADQVKLIDSKGNDLSKTLTVTAVEKYDKLIYAKSGDNNGLWIVKFKVNEGVTVGEANASFKAYDENWTLQNALYAVAINNTTSQDADRYVASTYDIKPGCSTYAAASAFMFNVNNTSVAEINNRFVTSPNATAEWRWHLSYGQSSKTAAELEYDANAVTVATLNTHNTSDERTSKDYLKVNVNEPFTINSVVPSKNTVYLNTQGDETQEIAYYYVTLDKRNAEAASAPSEWNVWNELYQYDGLYTMTKASDDLNITVKTASAAGDIIGFRVWAVNYDGTLADPDGRAFYVKVGNAPVVADAQADIVATSTTPKSNEFTLSLSKGYNYTLTANDWQKIYTSATTSSTLATSNVKLFKFDGSDYTIDITSGYTPSSNEEIKVKLYANNIPDWIDNTTYYFTYKGVKTADIDEKQVNIAITKKLPTTCPALTFKPTYETSTDAFTAFMSYQSAGVARLNLNNIFDGSLAGYKFKFKKSLWNSGSYSKDVEVTGAAANTNLDITYSKDRSIIYGTDHQVEVYRNYGNVSTTLTYDARGNETANYAQNVTIQGSNLTATYAVWHQYASVEWATATYYTSVLGGTDKVSMQPELTWNTTVTRSLVGNLTGYLTKSLAISNAPAIWVNNSKMSAYSKSLGNLITTADNQEGKLTVKAPRLLSGSSANPFYTPTIDMSLLTSPRLSFNVTSGLGANDGPKSVDNEILELNFVDEFGTPVQFKNLEVVVNP